MLLVSLRSKTNTLQFKIAFNPSALKNDYFLISPYNITLNPTWTSWEQRWWSPTKASTLHWYKQILLVSLFGNVQRTVWRIYILMVNTMKVIYQIHLDISILSHFQTLRVIIKQGILVWKLMDWISSNKFIWM